MYYDIFLKIFEWDQCDEYSRVLRVRNRFLYLAYCFRKIVYFFIHCFFQKLSGSICHKVVSYMQASKSNPNFEFRSQTFLDSLSLFLHGQASILHYVNYKFTDIFENFIDNFKVN